MKEITGIFTIIGLGISAIVALFLALELILRIVKWSIATYFLNEVKFKDFASDEYKHYIDWVESWDKAMFHYLPIGFRLFNTDNPIPPVKTNPLGFRCDTFTEPKEDELRIMILGGSTAWGCGASSNEATIAGQLEKLINSDKRLLNSFDKAKCYNLAQVNGSQTQDLLTVLFFASKIRPHYAVSLTGWNELACNYLMKPDIIKKYGVFYLYEMEGWEPLGVGENIVRLLNKTFWLWMSDKSQAIKILYSFKNKKNAVTKLSVKEQVCLGEEPFIRHLYLMQKLSKAFDFKHFQFMQPYIYRKKHLTEQENKVVYLYDNLRPVHGGKETSSFLSETDIYSSIMVSAQKDARLGSVVDLCDIFREEEDNMFYTLVHLNDAGYRKMAEKIYEVLLKSHQANSRNVDYAKFE